ncbi:uncharacterized protein LOC106647049 [Copidosoma floridanum]|uniref:uncharacterized protein LOC106647049 n=1 Tax=Copidosoma floridanum TaxID=29053 RepID=UPI0006C9CE49|nr:uncharacterized protein LOC106647049 [Copidosoma floridanum]
MAQVKRITFIVQKGVSLNSQLLEAKTALHDGNVSPNNAALCLEFLTNAFKKYEELHDELASLESDHVQFGELINWRSKFFLIDGKLQELRPPPTGVDPSCIALANSTFSEKTKLPKLLVTEIPLFNGIIDKLLSFKNAFSSIIRSRTDLDDVTKLTYLKSAMRGEALTKIAPLGLSAENYAKAWKLLTDSYERKHVLISKDLDALINIPHLQKQPQSVCQLW